MSSSLPVPSLPGLLEKLRHQAGPAGLVRGADAAAGVAVEVLVEQRIVAEELSRRMTRIFLRDGQGRRAVFGEQPKLQNDPHFRDHVLFYEYFHGDTGRGVGASHQTGWTGAIAKLLQPRRREPKQPQRKDA